MTPSAATGATSAQSQESEELARFRQEWLEELKRRREAAAAESQAKAVGASISNAGDSSKGPQLSPTRATFTRKPPAEGSAKKRHEGAAIPESALPAAHPALTSAGIVTAHLSPSIQNALKIYREAVEHEQNGDLDEALLLYRRAFRIVRLMHYLCSIISILDVHLKLNII